MERRQVLRTAALGAAAAVAVPAALAATGEAAVAGIAGGGPGLVNTGVGMYTDLSVASQMSAFTINPGLVSCGVGTFGVPLVGGSGPFSMIMFSTRIDSYTISNHSITAMGRMRSITSIAVGVIQENVEHDFIAVAVDNQGITADRFDVHFVTPFWTPGLTNPLATPSGLRPGWSRFGGNVAKVGLPLVGETPLGGVNA